MKEYDSLDAAFDRVDDSMKSLNGTITNMYLLLIAVCAFNLASKIIWGV